MPSEIKTQKLSRENCTGAETKRGPKGVSGSPAEIKGVKGNENEKQAEKRAKNS